MMILAKGMRCEAANPGGERYSGPALTPSTPVTNTQTPPQRPIAGGQIHFARGERADGGERLIQLAKLKVLRRRYPELIEPKCRKLRRQVHQLFRLRVSQRPQDHAIDDGEDGGIGTDGKGDRQDGDGCVNRRAEKTPDGDAKILAKLVEIHRALDGKERSRSSNK
jgi:hypothetical protein